MVLKKRGTRMSIFIKIKINEKTCKGFSECGECVKICPVNIFDKKENRIITIEVNEDECTLCNLCLDKCPVDAIEIEKLYDK